MERYKYAANNPAPEPLAAASMLAASRHRPIARCQWRPASEQDIQVFPWRSSQLTGANITDGTKKATPSFPQPDRKRYLAILADRHE